MNTPDVVTRETQKRRAQQAVQACVRAGAMVRPEKCEACGDRAKRIRAHHDDYDKPLAVSWLCDGCHFNRHTETLTAHAGRPRCIGCGKLIYRHSLDTNYYMRVGEWFAHVACVKDARTPSKSTAGVGGGRDSLIR